MGLLNFVNYVASFLLFISCILLIVASIGAPAINYLSFLTVDLDNGEKVSLGSWGMCLRRGGPDACTGSSVGYNAGAYLNGLIGSDFGSTSRSTIRVLTRAMVLHPIAAIFAFIAFLLSALSSVFGAILAMFVSLLTFILTIIVLGTDFGWTTLIRHRINDNNFRGSDAHYRELIWLVLAAAIFSFLATILLFIGCCSSRNRGTHEKEHVGRRRRFI